jgi:hypothetical protein
VPLLLDPLLLSYYLAGPKALVLVGGALGAAGFVQVRSMRREHAEHGVVRAGS